MGTGIGGGIILGGKLRRGFRWGAGEIGHVTIQLGGPVCGCGRLGHVEALASRGAMTRKFEEAIAAGEPTALADNEGRITSGAIRRALEANDPLAQHVISDAQNVLGVFIASVVNLLDPERIIMGGGLVESLGDPFLEPIRQVAYAGFLQQENAEAVKIVPAALGDDAVVLGAAVLVRQELKGL